MNQTFAIKFDFFDCLHFSNLYSGRTQARSKLNEALESSIEQNEKALLDADKQDKSSESENSDKETLNIKKEKEPTTAVNEIVSKQPRSPKAASSSYIMKLFDRSINLARYTEDTPLYVLSRNWMENSPRQVKINLLFGPKT